MINRQKGRDVRRERRKRRMRMRVRGNPERPRLAVFRSSRNIYAQIINDKVGMTLVAASTKDRDLREQIPNSGNTKAATMVGDKIAKLALEKGIQRVVFDRRSYLYHGRVKALAEAARAAGLNF